MPYLIGLDDDFGYLTELYGGGNKVFTTQYDGVQPIGALYDKDDQKGTPGQVLSSTSTALDWIDLPWLDVTNWSATPDDNVGTGKTGTVNRNAFQKAIGSLANKGGIIYVPHGDYPIQGTINIINTGNADDGNVWVSFPSAERNKVQEGDFLILKKQHNTVKAITSKNKKTNKKK